MALSTSTIVLGLATTACFGLAVRDQVKNGKPSPFGELKESREYAREPEIDREELEERMAEYQAREKERREEQAKLDAEREQARREAVAAAEEQLKKDRTRDVAALSKLFGSARATFGGALAGARIGMSSTDFVPKLAEVNKVTEPLLAQDTLVDDSGDVVRSVTLRPAIGCNDLQEHVAEIWGVAARAGSRWVWFDDKASMRVVLEKTDDRTCLFQFEQYAPGDRWLSPAANSVVPVAFLGRADIELITEIKRRPTAYGMTANDTTITWTDLGPNLGRGGTAFKATVAKGKVTAIEATIDADEAITTRLKAVFGKPAGEEASSLLTWTKPYYISWDGSTLTASTQKPEE